MLSAIQRRSHCRYLSKQRNSKDASGDPKASNQMPKVCDCAAGIAVNGITIGRPVADTASVEGLGEWARHDGTVAAGGDCSAARTGKPTWNETVEAVIIRGAYW